MEATKGTKAFEVRPYAAAIGITVAATLARAALMPVLGYRFPMLMYWPSIEIIAYYFGFRPAVFAVVLSLVCGRLLYIRPLLPLYSVSRTDAVAISLFIVFTTSLAKLMDTLRTAKAQAEENADLAERRLEQLQAEAEARRTDRYWAESVLASIGDGVIAADTAGKVSYINDVAEHLTGWSRGEAVEQPMDRVFHTIEQPPYPLLAAVGGRRIPVEHNESVIRSGKDQRLGTVRVFRDVTERQKAEETLEATKTMLHESLKAAGAAAWEWKPAAGEIVASHEFLALTGATGNGEGLPFRNWMEAVHPVDRERVESELTGASAGSAEVRLEYRTAGDEEYRWIAVMGRAAGACRMTGIVMDVTARREMEDRLRSAAKHESLAVLSGGIAHDFNNLLTSILGYASLMRSDEELDSQVAEYVGHIETASQQAAYLTRQMLAYAGQGRFTIERIHVAETVRAAVQELRGAMPPSIALTLRLEGEELEASADPRQFQQVVSNIVTNAIEAIGEGAGTITVATYGTEVEAADQDEAQLYPGGWAVFEVQDTGPGMNAETKAKIFDPFFTTKFTGRGLGLSAVQGIMRGHGGSISVDSAPGEGTRFRVFWPLAQSVGEKRGAAAGIPPGAP